MSVRAASPWVAVAVVAVMVLASLGLVGGLLGAAPAGHATGAAPAKTISTKAVPSASLALLLVGTGASRFTGDPEVALPEGGNRDSGSGMG